MSYDDYDETTSGGVDLSRNGDRLHDNDVFESSGTLIGPWYPSMAPAPVAPESPTLPVGDPGPPFHADFYDDADTGPIPVALMGYSQSDDLDLSRQRLVPQYASETERRIDQLAEQTRQDQQRARTARQRRKRIVLPAAAAGVVLVGVLAIALTGGGSDDPTQTASPAVSPAAPAPSPAAASWCPNSETAGRVSGDGAGDTRTAVGEIFFMQHQMYVERNADAVRSVFAPNAVVASLDSTRAAIAAIPQGTTHCVHVTAQSPTEYAVTLDQRAPDGAIQTWDSRVSMAAQPDGRLMITAVRAAAPN